MKKTEEYVPNFSDILSGWFISEPVITGDCILFYEFSACLRTICLLAFSTCDLLDLVQFLNAFKRLYKFPKSGVGMLFP